MSEVYRISFVVLGSNLDPSDVRSAVTEDIAPNLAARLDAFFDPDSIRVEGIADVRD